MNQCVCGAGIRSTEKGVEIRPHEIGCSVLREIATKAKTHCVACGLPLQFEQDGEIAYCPDGHTRRMEGEAMLGFLDATGSGWIRQILKPKL